MAESEGDTRVGEEYVRAAQSEAERELVIEGMEQLTTQGHLALAPVTILELGGYSGIRTRDVYDVYASLSDHIGADRLAQRRMRDHLIELDMLSIIRARNLPRDRSVVKPIRLNSVSSHRQRSRCWRLFLDSNRLSSTSLRKVGSTSSRH
nr:hypothetical protein [Halorubrum sp. BOL3-1]